MVLRLLYIAIGGGAGALLRYLISGLIQRNSSGIFPYGTLVVNCIGAFIIGCLWELFQGITISTNLKAFMFMGLLGAFTTFSTFNLETLNLIREKENMQALSNIAVNNISCLILVFLGSTLASLIIKFLNRGKI